MTDDQQPAQGSTPDYCSTWPADGHTLSSHHPGGTTIWILQCSSCGWIDGEDIERQVRERLYLS